jgi:hypothetical protein
MSTQPAEDDPALSEALLRDRDEHLTQLPGRE